MRCGQYLQLIMTRRLRQYGPDPESEFVAQTPMWVCGSSAVENCNGWGEEFAGQTKTTSRRPNIDVSAATYSISLHSLHDHPP
jgi:hypothetical protein